MKWSEFLTAAVTLVAGVSTYNLVTDHSFVNQTSNQASPQYMMSRYSTQSYGSNTQLNWQQLQAYIQQLQEQEQQQIQQLQQQRQEQQQQQWQQQPQQQQTDDDLQLKNSVNR